MEEIKEAQPKHYIYYKDYNKINDEGCKHLKKAAWNNLTHLELGISSIRKGAIILEISVANILLKLVGGILSVYVLVKTFL